MADPYGVYDRLFNLIPSNATTEMRAEAESWFFKIFDAKWSPVLQGIMPRVAGFRGDGGIPSMDDEMKINTMVDPQTMARASDSMDRTKPRGLGSGSEYYQARMFHEDGPQSDPFEFEHELKSGFLSRRNTMLADNAIKSISRRIEYELCGVVRGTQAFLDNYGDQYTKQISAGRQKLFDADQQTSSHAQYLTGYRADDTTNFDLQDVIAEVNLYMDSKYTEATNAFIGANSSYYIRKNTKLKDYRKYHVDLVANQLSNTIDGVQFQKIKGQTYKDDSVNSSRVGYPGFGNLAADTFGSPTLKKMMVDTGVTPHEGGGTISTEWAIFTSGNIGYTFTARTNPKQVDPTIPYVHSWENKEFGYMYSRLQLAICPAINDFSEFIVVNNFCKTKI